MSNTERTVREIVIYKIKADHVDSFPEKVLPEMRAFVMNCPGIMSYQSFKANKNHGIVADIVEWDSLEVAEAAAAEMKKRSEAGEFPEMAAAFEKVEFFDHFKLIS